MFCPKCGAPSDEDALFCGNCGADMMSGELPADAEAGIAEDAVKTAAEPEGEEAPFAEFLVDPSADEFSAELPPPPAPPAYPAPAAVAPAVPSSGLAIASLVLGIAGLTFLPLLASIAAIILGYMARNDIRQRPGQVSGDGLAVAGIVMGWIAVGITVLAVLGFGASICGFGLCGITSSGW